MARVMSRDEQSVKEKSVRRARADSALAHCVCEICS
jgi:hypothetical protein